MIGEIARDACTELCAATPGVRLISGSRDGEILYVEQTCGDFTEVPVTLAADIMGTADGASGMSVSGRALLDASVGAPMAWAGIEISDSLRGSWMYAGAPDKIVAEALLALRSLINQVMLAMLNSGSHRELTVQAPADSLTGLANRATFNAELSADLAPQCSRLVAPRPVHRPRRLQECQRCPGSPSR